MTKRLNYLLNKKFLTVKQLIELAENKNVGAIESIGKGRYEVRLYSGEEFVIEGVN
jgi:hypothetical protein